MCLPAPADWSVIAPSSKDSSDAQPHEVSVVMPCLNEAETVVPCIQKALAAFAAAGIDGEVIVADNGSTDGSQDLAIAAGARVVAVPTPGYGAALIGGIEAARSRFVIMGDADDSYDFGELPKFVRALREGNDLVQGCRLPGGGGTVAPGAMPFLHRWWGNPMFSWMARRWFKAPIHDVYCGMRGFDRQWQASLEQRCTGMEFATEMIIKASLGGARIAEVPITLHKDGRTVHPPHLKTFRDGWRTLRFFLMCSPRSLFEWPGVLLTVAGLVLFGMALGDVHVGGARIGVHSMLVGGVAVLCGMQALSLARLARTFAITEGILPTSPDRPGVPPSSLERTLVLSFGMVLLGVGMLVAATLQWRATGFGDLDYDTSMRVVIMGAILVALGVQQGFVAFLGGLLVLRRR